MIADNATWFITGCSKGLGRALAHEVLSTGARCVATARSAATLHEFSEQYGDRVQVAELDVTNREQALRAVEAASERFGAVDVLVNNAGYGYLGAIEEGEDQGVREMFETNVYGAWNLIKAVLPGMRSRGTGHIVNISSVGGLVTFPGVGFYHMAKFALEGLSETLAQEVRPFGVAVTIVEPGAFRTDFRGGSLQQSNTHLSDYAATVGQARARVVGSHGQQRGDPKRAAGAILAAVRAEQPPLHLLLGSDALEQVGAKLAALQRDIDTWREVSAGTDLSS